MQQISITEEKQFESVGVFPFTYAPSPSKEMSSDEVVSYTKANYADLMKTLLKHGAILFRGFNIKDAKDFNEFSLAFGWEDLPYIGGAAVRKNVYGVVFTSNESPPDQPIPFHHEMAQVPKFPSNLFFYCDIPSVDGGETPIVLSNIVYEQCLRELPDFVRALEEKGVIYERTIPENDDSESAIGRGWKSTFLTEDKSVAEQRCTAHGGTFEWLENGNLKTITKVMPAIRTDERTGKKMWFNSIVAAYFGWVDERNEPSKAVKYGDGTLLEPENVKRAKEILDENAIAFKWEKNDVLLVDNHQVLHSRKTFVPPRRVLATLFQ